MRNSRKTIGLLALLAAVCFNAGAQQIRTAYFFDNAPAANYLNPATMPERGFIAIPGLGTLGASYLSNGMAPGDLFFVQGNDVRFFMDDKVPADKFLKNISKYNTMNIDANTDLLSAGWHMGKGFATLSVGVKANVNMGIPREMFELMKLEAIDGDNYSIKDFRLSAESYAQLALGYARPVNKRLTVGGKVKLLAGLANLDMKVDRLLTDYDYSQMRWEVRAKGSFRGSMKGFSAKSDNKGYLNDFDFDSPGIGGMGVAVDLGASYKLLDNLRVSASVLDLGFISWRKSATTSGDIDVHNTAYFDGFNNKEDIEDALSGLEDMFQFRESAPKGRTTMLRATLNIGAEYSIMNNKISFGLLSSTRFYQPKAYTEITASANFRPAKWFTGAVSYSFIHSEFKTLGLAMNFHTSYINFFLGSDYMIFEAQKGIPASAQSANVYLGLSVPLGKRKSL